LTVVNRLGGVAALIFNVRSTYANAKCATIITVFAFLYQICSRYSLKINSFQRHFQAVLVLIVDFGWVMNLFRRRLLFWRIFYLRLNSKILWRVNLWLFDDNRRSLLRYLQHS